MWRCRPSSSPCRSLVRTPSEGPLPHAAHAPTFACTPPIRGDATVVPKQGGKVGVMMDEPKGVALRVASEYTPFSSASVLQAARSGSQGTEADAVAYKHQIDSAAAGAWPRGNAQSNVASCLAQNAGRCQRLLGKLQ